MPPTKTAALKGRNGETQYPKRKSSLQPYKEDGVTIKYCLKTHPNNETVESRPSCPGQPQPSSSVVAISSHDIGLTNTGRPKPLLNTRLSDLYSLETSQVDSYSDIGLQPDEKYNIMYQVSKKYDQFSGMSCMLSDNTFS